METIEKDQARFFDQLSVIGTDKQALSASIVLAADLAAEKIIFGDGITLSTADILPYLRTPGDVDTGKNAHEYLIDWVAENRGGFIVNGDLESLKARSVLGCMDVAANGDVQRVWIINKAFVSAFDGSGYNPDSYLSWAIGKKILLADTGSKKKVKRLPGLGVTARCVCISFEKAQQIEDQLGMTMVYDADLPF